MFFGCAVRAGPLLADRRYQDLIRREAGLIVPEGELKWSNISRADGSYDYGRANILLEFAQRSSQRMRGHALVWHQAVPSWAERDLSRMSPSDGQRLLERHVERVASDWRGKLAHWDVVNEALDSAQADGVRRSIFFDVYKGVGYLDAAFHVAHDADPGAQLTYNDYGFEDDWGDTDLRRSSLLRLLSGLKNRGVPIHAVGLQAHISATARFDAKRYGSFLKELSDLGLAIFVTEFDVNDRDVPSQNPRRDAMVADAGARFLDVAFENPAVSGLLTWGISDLYCWMNDWGDYFRRDHSGARSLPYDAEFRPKALHHVIAGAFRNASRRP